MKLMVKFSENGPTRSLNRIVGVILAVLAFAGLILLTCKCLDAEDRRQDLEIQRFLYERNRMTLDQHIYCK